MSQACYSYLCQKRDAARRFELELVSSFGYDSVQSSHLALQFLDTFDGRLQCAGMSAEWLESNSGNELRITERDSDTVLSTQRGIKLPRFAGDLSEPLHSRLEPVLGLRALLPQLSLQGRERRFVLSDREEKILVRVHLQQLSLTQFAPGAAGRVAWLCRVWPLRGYTKYSRPLIKALDEDRDWLALEHGFRRYLLDQPHCPSLTRALSLKVSLDADERSDAALRSILMRLTDIMEANEAGVIQQWDTEFLHDFRIAVRRTRAVLGQMKSVFPAKLLQRYHREFAWLGSVTSMQRDMDVYLLGFDSYRSAIPVKLRRGLDPLHELIQVRQAEAHEKVCRALGSARYRRLKQSWRRYLGSDLPKRPLAKDARRPIQDLAGHRIWRAYRKVIREGRELNKDSPDEGFHELRKSCKKLRYLIEFFRPLYPADKLKELIKALKGLQNNLGEYQDLCVQITALNHWVDELDMEAAPHAPVKPSIKALVRSLERRKRKIHRKYQTRFDAFSSKRNLRLFKLLFKRATPLVEAS